VAPCSRASQRIKRECLPGNVAMRRVLGSIGNQAGDAIAA
jgi:hypothetical protein